MMNLHVIILPVLVCLCCSTHGQLWSPEIEQNIVAFINNLMTCRRLTGLSVVITTGENTLMERAFGYKDVELAEPADENTRFCIGSLTKAFTSTVLGSLLAEKEQLYPKGWDTPLKDVFGDSFMLSEPYLTDLMTIKDTLAHKTGFAQYGGALATLQDPHIQRMEACQRFQHLDMIRDFRTDFVYNNWMYMLASCVAEVLGDAEYETLVRERIFNVLGMNNTLFPGEITDWNQIATAYYINASSGEMLPMAPELIRIYPADASGGICAPATDLTRWLQFQLSKKPSILPTLKWIDTVSPCFPRGQPYIAKPFYPVTDDTPNYGMGWVMGTYREFKKAQHAGSINGFQTLMTVYNALDLAILTVSGGPMYPGDTHKVLHYYITDLILGLEPWLDNTTACTYPAPWSNFTDDARNVFDSEDFQELVMDMTDEDLESIPADDTNNDNIAQWYEAYIGQYGHLFFGNITVFYDDLTDKLRFIAGTFGIGFLTPDDTLPGKVLISLDEQLAYIHWLESSLNFYPPMIFRNQDNTTGLYQEILNQAYDSLVPPIFRRDVQWND